MFARERETFPELRTIRLTPIGIVRNGVKEPQPHGWADVVSRIVIKPDISDALLGLDGYSHVIVLFWPHRVPDDVRGSKRQLHPMDDERNPLMGVLATRSQIRFNPVLVSPVRLLGVKGNVLRVRGLDAIDGTPVIDIKPYMPHYDAVADAKGPRWLSEARERAEREGRR